ncbi:bifunctional hydroxymethylpyrimidine kinase/phosphomethylpyrimidine kinase [Novosphingobium sp. KACC 22771]|uniref:bifunctional hydroxymethylpyrimidine kinase/phosphomethylpyrimidine kinase n=1 Tax=Novosphingobium sp. KACC 22771 TaxID=3025670 RepID=UPI002366DD5B|nr:bifunctional hydroxymethylpyrimidine kinase/phosphomethylpyrimidine kinase [Novosphingobium sp. KACC 22771]WDF72335.1 bifunctional hydroxymethylpyrimidine kinase/phosphomethylpyrimidine kinase [Novosphingobium sp. KACC 22771]
MKPARILTIAGSDCSGGAGLQADLKTIIMLGGYGMSAITAITAQNTTGVFAVEPLSPEMVAAQIDACIDDIGVDAVKIGMLGSAAITHIVADRLEKIAAPVVFDPVMIATSGGVLADAETVAAFDRMMALAALTTPNLPELAALGGEAKVRAKTRALLIKGGHGEGPVIEDRLIIDGGEFSFTSQRIDTNHTHGTGCTLASAIATGLGQGMAMDDAVRRAGEFVHAALLAAPGFGAGHGPLGHQAVRL